MKKTLRRFCLSTVLCGTALLAAMQQGAAQSESASSRILRTTPQSVEDLQRIEHQLQAVLPKVLPALVCIQVNNSSGTGILVSEKGLIFLRRPRSRQKRYRPQNHLAGRYPHTGKNHGGEQ